MITDDVYEYKEILEKYEFYVTYSDNAVKLYDITSGKDISGKKSVEDGFIINKGGSSFDVTVTRNKEKASKVEDLTSIVKPGTYTIEISSQEQQQYAALTASGVPFSVRLSDERIFFAYDADYKEEVDEIIKKATSEEYADFRRELWENFKGDKCLHFLPVAAEILHMTEGTLRCRPLDVQYSVCRRYADYCICDSYTLRRELEKALLLKTD
ncbi:MAG: hypothetical protein IKH27_12450 [Oscillospiraceae bacterium]|nr:hypothetical protein [Oscillospiraceae bacterium]MBR3448605.1 hypothetical protein [Oscillospiraceae bacterium]